ncbi:hypothetical protein ABPG72_015066 [Tetrahymena utriculariae]
MENKNYEKYQNYQQNIQNLREGQQIDDELPSDINQQVFNLKPQQTIEKLTFVPKGQQYFEVNNLRGEKLVQSTNAQIIQLQSGEYQEQIKQNSQNEVFSNQFNQFKNQEDQIFRK